MMGGETHTLTNIEPYIVKTVGNKFMVFLTGDMNVFKYDLVLIPKSIWDTEVYNIKGSYGFGMSLIDIHLLDI